MQLERILAAARIVFGDAFNPQITLKALSYFADGSLPTLPHAAVERLVRAVSLVDLDRLPDLSAVAPARPHERPQP
jgi:hypothetical protein